MLVKRLQTVQNEATKIISGTFRTTPREPLHQLLNIFPMDLRLDMLAKHSAIRLYGLPCANQLLRGLGGSWHGPNPGDPPLPTPNNARNNTTLRSLVARVQRKVRASPRTRSFLTEHRTGVDASKPSTKEKTKANTYSLMRSSTSAV